VGRRTDRLANLAALMGDPDRASALFDEADRVAEDDAFGPVVARALTGLAVRHRQACRLELAEDAAQRALALYRGTDYEPGVIGSLCTLGFINEVRGMAAEAEKLHCEALLVARKLGDPKGLALCLEGLAGVALLEQDTRQSASLLGDAFGLREGQGIPESGLAGGACSFPSAGEYSAIVSTPSGSSPKDGSGWEIKTSRRPLPPARRRVSRT
jgi:hypothetical protein